MLVTCKLFLNKHNSKITKKGIVKNVDVLKTFLHESFMYKFPDIRNFFFLRVDKFVYVH